MDRIRSSAEGQAVLAGSLVAFPLLDVLSLLDKTHHTGGLKVVSEGSDDHFFVDGGDLIDPSGGATGRLFELACAGDAWFTVTADPGPRTAGSRVALRTVLDHLTPRLSEWDALRQAVPLDATARMAPSTAVPEVHVRSDQWKVLSRLGSGRRVGDVVDETDGSPVETLRVLRELAEAGLVALGGPAALPPPRRTRTPPRGTASSPARPEEARRGPVPEARGEGRPDGEGKHARDDGPAREAQPARAVRPAGPARSVRPARSSAERPMVIDPRVPTSLMPPPLVTRPWATAGSVRRA